MVITDSNGVKHTVTTAPNGDYVVTDLPPGTATVDIDQEALGLPEGSLKTEGSVTIEPGKNTKAGDEPIPSPLNPGTVSGLVFQDTNGNGKQDPGEPGLAGVHVIITDSSGAKQTVTTSQDGSWQATVRPGTTTIDVDNDTLGLPDDAKQTAGQDPSTVTATSGQNVDAGDDGFFVPGTLSGSIFEDLNNDGKRDPGEPGIPGIQVVITDSNGVKHTVTTAPNGDYVVTDLPPGTATVDIDQEALGLPEGSLKTEGSVTIEPGKNTKAGDEPIPSPLNPGTVSGLVFQDTNGNGKQDPGEPGLAGVHVIITDSSGAKQTVTTSQDGSWQATVRPGTTTIDVDNDTLGLPGDAKQTAGQDPSTVTATSGQNVDAGDDGFFVPGTLSGSIFEDLNNDGKRDPGEPGIPGIQVVITDSNGVKHTVTTAPNGDYVVTDLPPGTATVDIDQEALGLPEGSLKTEGSVTIEPGKNTKAGDEPVVKVFPNIPGAEPTSPPQMTGKKVKKSRAPTPRPSLAPSQTRTVPPTSSNGGQTLGPTPSLSTAPSSRSSATPTLLGSSQPSLLNKSDGPSVPPGIGPSSRPSVHPTLKQSVSPSASQAPTHIELGHPSSVPSFAPSTTASVSPSSISSQGNFPPAPTPNTGSGKGGKGKGSKSSAPRWSSAPTAAPVDEGYIPNTGSGKGGQSKGSKSSAPRWSSAPTVPPVDEGYSPNTGSGKGGQSKGSKSSAPRWSSAPTVPPVDEGYIPNTGSGKGGQSKGSKSSAPRWSSAPTVPPVDEGYSPNTGSGKGGQSKGSKSSAPRWSSAPTVPPVDEGYIPNTGSGKGGQSKGSKSSAPRWSSAPTVPPVDEGYIPNTGSGKGGQSKGSKSSAPRWSSAPTVPPVDEGYSPNTGSGKGGQSKGSKSSAPRWSSAPTVPPVDEGYIPNTGSGKGGQSKGSKSSAPRWSSAPTVPPVDEVYSPNTGSGKGGQSKGSKSSAPRWSSAPTVPPVDEGYSPNTGSGKGGKGKGSKEKRSSTPNLRPSSTPSWSSAPTVPPVDDAYIPDTESGKEGKGKGFSFPSIGGNSGGKGKGGKGGMVAEGPVEGNSGDKGKGGKGGMVAVNPLLERKLTSSERSTERRPGLRKPKGDHSKRSRRL